MWLQTLVALFQTIVGGAENSSCCAARYAAVMKINEIGKVWMNMVYGSVYRLATDSKNCLYFHVMNLAVYFCLFFPCRVCVDWVLWSQDWSTFFIVDKDCILSRFNKCFTDPPPTPHTHTYYPPGSSKSTALRNNLHWEQGGKFLWTLATALILHFLLSQTVAGFAERTNKCNTRWN